MEEDMNITQLKKAMALLRENLNVEVPISQIEIFLIIAENEGINEEGIIEQIKIPKPTFKRNLKRLTDIAKGAVLMEGGGGYAICEINDDGSIVLTEKGKQLIQDLSTLS